MIRILGLFCALLFLQGCADMDISNPFGSSTTDANEVYYDQFVDIPIPRDMDVDRKRSLVSVTPEGTKIGLITTEGRVDMASLSNAMAHNMAQQGWSIRTKVSGPKMVEVFEKDSRVAVLYFYEQTTSTAMEIWAAIRLPDGFVSPNQPGAGTLGGDPYGSSPNMGAGGAGGYNPNTSGSGTMPLTQ